MKDKIVERPRRFYKTVTVAEAPGGFGVRLDDRPTKTPGKVELFAPNRALAEAIAAEWEAQDEYIEIDRMLLTRLANVAVDRTPQARGDIAVHVAGYAETDLTCHVADEEPALLARQEAVFAPLRDWAGETLGVKLVRASGILATPQPADSLTAARVAAESLDDFALTGLAHATGLFGSIVLALALAHQRVTGDEAFAAFRIDEVWQEEKWGADAEAAARTEGQAREAVALERWFEALTDG